MAIAWIIGGIVLSILELFTLDLFFVTIGIAAFGAGLAAFLGAPIWLQVAIFAVIAIALLFGVRPWARRQLKKTTPDIDTNVRGLIGKTAIVTKPLVGPGGRVRLEGEEWSARGKRGSVFAVGSEVKVVQIEGATAVVGPLEEDVAVPPDSVPTLGEDQDPTGNTPPIIN